MKWTELDVLRSEKYGLRRPFKQIVFDILLGRFGEWLRGRCQNVECSKSKCSGHVSRRTTMKWNELDLLYKKMHIEPPKDPLTNLFLQFYWIFLANFLVLGYLGSQPAEGIYVIISRIATVYYFVHFIIIMPLLGFVEKTKPLPKSISEPVLNDKERAAKAATA